MNGEVPDVDHAARVAIFIVGLAKQYRGLNDAAKIMRVTAEAVARELCANGAGYCITPAACAPNLPAANWSDGTGLSVIPDLLWDTIEQDLRAGKKFASGETASKFNPGGSSNVGAQALIAIPLMRDSVFQGAFYVNQVEARSWTTAEVALVEAIAEVSWDAAQNALAMAGVLRRGEKLRRAFEQAPSFIALLDGRDHRYEMTNAAHSRLVGERAMDGMTVAEALPETVDQGFVALMDEVYRTGKPYVTTSAKYSPPSVSGGGPEDHYVDFVYQPLKDEAGSVVGILVIGTDVTERVKAQENLQQWNADLERQVIERSSERGTTWQVSPHLLSVISLLEGKFIRVNPAWTAQLGWSEEELNGKPFEDFLHPDDVARSYAAFDEILSGRPVLHFENRYRAKDGTYRWLSWVAVPENGKLYSSARDVTSEKEMTANLARTEEALRQSQKMEAIGQLTGGIAHDFNNMLGVMLGNLELLQEKIAHDPEASLLIGRIDQSVEASADLIQRLLTFARRHPMSARSTDVGGLVSNLEQILERTIGEDITLRVVKASALWQAVVDPAQLEAALLNLVINAKDAMPGGGKLTIEFNNVTLDETYAALEPDLSPGDYVAIYVSDTGSGMTPEVITRAFEPFYTTKEVGKGTGLGLSMVFGFAKQSNGHVRIYSEVGHGTVVKLYLPRGVPVDAAVSETLQVQNTANSESILVVEDDDLVREMTSKQLQSMGYDVTAVPSGKDALSVLEDGKNIDLLLTDVIMPGGMTGPELARIAQNSWPNLKVMFVSGYTAHAMIDQDWLTTADNLLQKPFRKKDLATLVRKLLGGGATL